MAATSVRKSSFELVSRLTLAPGGRPLDGWRRPIDSARLRDEIGVRQGGERPATLLHLGEPLVGPGKGVVERLEAAGDQQTAVDQKLALAAERVTSDPTFRAPATLIEVPERRIQQIDVGV